MYSTITSFLIEPKTSKNQIMKSIIYIFIIACCLKSNGTKAQNVEIQYLANEGVLIKSANTQILIDAIFNKEFDYLDVLPDSELTKIENAEAQYKSIDIILATHLHGDHFNAQIVGKHLIANKSTLFFGPYETVSNFKANFEEFQSISPRISAETPNLFEAKTITLKNTTIKILRLEHLGTSPWKEAENVAYLITIDDKKILHLGDSIIDIKNLENFGLEKENIDVAILPYWQLGSSEQKEIIKKYINPKQILVAHIPLKSYPVAQKSINSLGYKNTKVLVKSFDITVVD